MNTLIFLLLIHFFVVIPLSLTITNIVLLFFKKADQKLVNSIDFLTIFLGVIFTHFLFLISRFHEWNVQITTLDDYTHISFKHMPTFYVLFILSILGYITLRLRKTNLPPIISCLCLTSIWIGYLLCVFWCIQISSNFKEPEFIFFVIFPLNYILCSIRLLKEFLTDIKQVYNDKTYKNKFLNWCNNLINKSYKLVSISFVLILPVFILISIILILFGQQPDSIIKAFTETADWTFSQQIPPPRLDGHYLCTVAACGDEKKVKPIRVGIRNNQKIIVNRQLLIANAFEELISVKTPKLHRVIRNFYDKYGYPISKHITSKKRSNFVYYLMKPLELIFLITLYTLDQ